MKFKKGICPNCKEELQINEKRKLATCPFCGTEYNVRKTLILKDELIEEKNAEKKAKSEKSKIDNEQNEPAIKYYEVLSINKNFIVAIFGAISIALLILALIFLYPAQTTDEVTEQITKETTVSTNILTEESEKHSEQEETGVTLQIMDDDGNIIEEWTSTDTPHKINGKLEAGSQYTLHAEDMPEGYYYSDSGLFEFSRSMIDFLRPILQIISMIMTILSLIRFVVSIVTEKVENCSSSMATLFTGIAILTIATIF